MKNLAKEIQELSRLQEQKDSAYFNWFKNIVSIATALFAILVSLKSEQSKTECEHLLFVLLVSSLGLGILLGVIVLYAEPRILGLLRDKKHEQITQLLDGKGFSIDHIKTPWIYKWIEVISLGSFVISLLTLIAYSIMLDK